jgi:hypothetical protein
MTVDQVNLILKISQRLFARRPNFALQNFINKTLKLLECHLYMQEGSLLFCLSSRNLPNHGNLCCALVTIGKPLTSKGALTWFGKVLIYKVQELLIIEQFCQK